MKTNKTKSWMLFIILISFSAFEGEKVYAQFGPAINLSGNPSKSLAPSVAAEGSNVYVVWYDQGSSGIPEIFFRRSTDEGRTFMPVVNLSNTPGGSLLPQVATAGSEVYVVWEDDTGAPPFIKEIYFRRSPDQGVTWNPPLDMPPQNLSMTSATNSVSPMLAVAGPEVYVAWQENTSPKREIRYCRSTDAGGSFGVSMTLSDSMLDSFSPDIAAAGSNVYLTWVERILAGGTAGGESLEIRFSRSIDEGQTFELNINLSRTSGASLSPSVTTAGSAVYVAWRDESGTPADVPEILFAFSTDQGASFTSTVDPVTRFNVSETPLQASFAPRMAAAGSSFFFVWQDQLPGNFEIMLRSPSLLGPKAIEFSSRRPVNLSATPEDSRLPSVAVTGSNLYVVWEEGEVLSPGEIMFKRATPALGSSPDNLSANRSRPAITPNMAVDGSDVYAVWSQFPDAATGLEVFVRQSTDSGKNFSPRFNLSDRFGDSSHPRVAAAGQAVYVVWQEDADTPGVHDIFFRRSVNRGVTWDSPMNLSDFGGIFTNDSRAPTIAAIGSEVYVAWEDETTKDGSPQIFFRRSLDQGVTWDDPLQVTCEFTGKRFQAFAPGLAVAGSNVYLIWKQFAGGRLEIHLIFTTEEKGHHVCGATVGAGFVNLTDGLDPVLVDDPLSARVAEPQVAAAGSMVYVIWRQEDEILFRRSRIVGEPKEEDTIWDPPIKMPAANLSMNPKVSRAPTIATAGSEVYVAWQNETNLGPPEILFRRSKDMGASFSSPASNLSDNGGFSENPWLAAAGSSVYLAWEDDTNQPVFSDILFLSSTDEGEGFLSRPICKGPFSECEGETPIGVPIFMDFSQVILTFDSVTGAGKTRLSVSNRGLPPPSKVNFGAHPTYYYLSTSAAFTGKATVSIHYDKTRFASPFTVNEKRLRLFQFQLFGGGWRDVTSAFDPRSQVISGVITGLSPLAIGFSSP